MTTIKTQLKTHQALDRFKLVAAIFILAIGTGGQAMAQAPTVDGLFYGNGDNNRYPAQPYAVSVGGSKLYATLVDGILYVALVVDRSVNDNVFDLAPGAAGAYMESAGWGGHRSARRLCDSEYAGFSLIVGEGVDQQSYVWQHGYAGQPGVSAASLDKTQATWVSNTLVAGGGGTPPPGLVSASSMQWNMNNYATRLAAGTNAWTMPGADTDPNKWKSPFNPSAPGDVTEVDGYPDAGQITWSNDYEWEWSMVYEWSVDLTQFGPTPTFVLAGKSHHSPPKTGLEDDAFPEPDPDDPPPPPLQDFGDLPAPYPTALANDGPRHNIDANGARLGASIDSEPDGQPHPDALGDDLAGVDDEDGVELLTDLVPGQNAVLRVNIGVPGYLSVFVDWNESGTLIAMNLLSATGPVGVAAGNILDTHFSVVGDYDLTVAVPVNASGTATFRFRITNLTGQGGISPTGLATSGEVEDYRMPITPAPAPDLTIFKTVTNHHNPVSGTTNPKSIPGASMHYTITVMNSGNGTVDAGTMFVTDAIPPNTELFVGDINGAESGPVLFANGAVSSGLTYTFDDDISFSNDGGGTYNYTPVPDPDGYDPLVTHLRVNPQGEFAAASNGDTPSFSIIFRVRIH